MPSSGMSFGGGILYPPIITTATLPSAVQNQPYSFQLTAINGFPPYNWSLVSGPAGLAVSSSGQITWTPPGTGLFPISVTVTDSMGGVPNAPANLQVSVAANLQIQTSTPLPNGAVGTPYSVTFTATGGVLPYTWIFVSGQPAWATLNGSTGLMSGTPTSGETDSFIVQVQDSSSPHIFASKSFSLTVPGTVAPGAPQAIFRGTVTSDHILVASWPPLSGTVDSYNCYREDSPTPLATGIVPTAPTAGAVPQIYFCDQNLAPNSTHTYSFTAVTAGIESARGPSITLTTKAGQTASTPPTPPTPWTPPPYSLPIGGTTWTATLTSSAQALTPGTGTLGQTNCGLQYALNNASYGDVITLTAGATYIYNNGGGFTPPTTWQGSPANGPVNIGSSAVANLPPQSSRTGARVPLQSFNCTGPIAANALSATLAVPWAAKTARNPVLFTHSDLSQESHDVTFTSGLSAITWTDYPIQMAAAAAITVGMLDCVTPTDLPNMATIQTNNSGFALSFANPTTQVRITGINFAPPPGNITGNIFACINFANATASTRTIPLPDHVTIERCLFGNDSTNLATFSYVRRGIFASCNHLQVDSCYFYGIYGGDGPDANCVGALAGQFNNYTNCFFEAASESVIPGGGYVSQTAIPSDWQIYGNWSQKNGQWKLRFPASLTAPPATGTPNGTLTAPWAQQSGQYLIVFSGGTTSPATFTNGLTAVSWTFANAGNGATATLTVLPIAGNEVKNHFETKVIERLQCHDNICLNAWNNGASGQHGRALVFAARDQQSSTSTRAITDCCPWAHVTDVDAYNNLCIEVGSIGVCFGTDYCASVYTERNRFFNNSAYVNPIPYTTPSYGTGIYVYGPVSDITVDHNSAIVNRTQVFNPGDAAGVQHAVNHVVPFTFQFSDRVTFTNNAFDGALGIFTQTANGSAAFVDGAAALALSFTNYTWSNNLILSAPAPAGGWPAGSNTFNDVYANVGFANFQGVAPPATPGSWDIVSGTYATASTTGGPIGATFGSGQVKIVTTSLPNAIVGTNYNTIAAPLAAIGGSGNYRWSLESAAPNRHLWGGVTAAGQPYGIPECDNLGQSNLPDTWVVRCTDAANSANSITATFTINITVSGALTIVSPTTLPNAAINGGYAYQLIAQGGAPPYLNCQITAHTGSNTWFLTNEGGLYGVPTVASTDTVTVQFIDCTNNISPAVTFSITTTSAIQLANVDYLNNVVKLPPARAGHKYRHQLHPANGGTGASQVFSIVNGSLPSGLSMTTGGLITGTPTSAGNANCSLQCVDSGANTTAAIPIALNIAAQSKGTRPAANTGTGFFVDTTGLLCDPSGFRFIPRGINRNHYDQTFSGYATSGCSAVRYTLYHTIFRGTTPAGAQSMATYAADAVAQHTNNNQYVIFTNFYQPGTTVNLTLGTTPADGGLVAAWWCDNFAAWAASGLQGKAGINLQNEWGPTGAAFQNCYQAVNNIPITSVSGTTITLNSNAATHPFANAAVITYIYISGGNINKAVNISAITGGSQGAWTLTAINAADVSAYTSGGTVSGGMIGMVRAAGYTDPIYIDCMNGGQFINAIVTYSQAIAASDPLQNIVFSYHAYGATVNYTGRIANIVGSTITFNTSATNNPMQPTATFSNVNDVWVSGVTGTMGANVNGDRTTNSNGHAGSTGAWTVPLTSAPAGVYGGGGLVVPGVLPAASGQNYHHPDRLMATMLSLQQSGLAFQIGEFGPGGNGGPSPTTMQYMEMVQACEAAGIGYFYWAMDDTTTVGTPPGNPATYTFGITGSAGNGTYTVPTQLQANGIDIVLNPNYGLHSLASPAPVFLP